MITIRSLMRMARTPLGYARRKIALIPTGFSPPLRCPWFGYAKQVGRQWNNTCVDQLLSIGRSAHGRRSGSSICRSSGLCCGGYWVGGIGRGRGPERRLEAGGGGARSRRHGQRPPSARAGGLPAADPQRVRLGLSHRTAGRPQRPPDLLAQGEGSWGLVIVERNDVGARFRGRLRRVGGTQRRAVGLFVDCA